MGSNYKNNMPKVLEVDRNGIWSGGFTNVIENTGVSQLAAKGNNSNCTGNTCLNKCSNSCANGGKCADGTLPVKF